MFRQIIDTRSQKGDLDLRRAGIARSCCVLLYNRSLAFLCQHSNTRNLSVVRLSAGPDTDKLTQFPETCIITLKPEAATLFWKRKRRKASQTAQPRRRCANRWRNVAGARERWRIWRVAGPTKRRNSISSKDLNSRPTI